MQLIALILCSLAVLGEVARDIFREGDFGGYIAAGKLAWEKTYIYSDFRNTWPPFFSIVSIPLYLANEWSFSGLRLLWLMGIVATHLYIFNWTITHFTQKPIFSFHEKKLTTHLLEPLFILSFLSTFRIFLEELSNLQINIFILGISVLILKLLIEEKDLIAGLLLAIIISIKVYPIILLGFLIIKKRYKAVLATLLGVLVSSLIVIGYFGIKQGGQFFLDWNTTQVIQGLKCEYMNQSLWGWMCGLLTNNTRMESIDYHILALSDQSLKMATLIVLAILGTYVLFQFYRSRPSQLSFVTQYIITLSFIPIVSPVAWKYYFVFLTPLIILLIYQRLHTSGWFYIPVFLITLSSELFVGSYISDVLETIGVITFSSLTLSLLSIKQLLNQTQ